MEVITTCSPHNFELVKSLGADAVYNYRDADVGHKIRERTQNKLKYVFDCISEETSMQICADALSSEPGGQYSALLDYGKFPREDVSARRTLAYSITGEDYQTGPKARRVEGNKEDFDFAKKFGELASALLAEGKIEVHPPTVKPGGLAGVLDGLQLMREGKVSGEKLVYRVADTP